MPHRNPSRAAAAVTAFTAVALAVVVLAIPAHGQAGGPAPAPVIVKDTNYAIPSNAKFVATVGNDAGDGSQTSPWRTVQKAVNASPSGGTIVIRGGTYRESVALSNKTLTIQAYPHEEVWLKGSVVVTGWVADGTTWRKDAWNYRFNRVTTPSGYIDSAYPMAGYPDMVYVNGRPLRQVSAKAQVAAGTFYVDEANSQLYIGDDPTGRMVEGAAYQNALVLYNAPNSKILGLGFGHAASQANSASSAVIVNTSNAVLLENNTFAWNAASGVEIGQLSDDVVVRGNEMVNNGLVGATSWGSPRRLTFRGNHAASNNAERFSIHWASGGVKLNGIIEATVSDNTIENNVGVGLWCDNGCANVKIVRNVSRNNTFPGIMYEISDGGIIASNIAVNNGGTGGGGIYVSESPNVKVYNNTIVTNAVPNARSIDVNSNTRKTTTGVVIKNNLFSHSSSSSLWVVRVQDDTNTLGADSMVSAIDYNGHYRQSSGSPAIAVRWGRPGGYDDFAGLSAFQSAKAKELNGVAIDGQLTNPFFVDETAGDYRLKTGSIAVSRGQALPQDVATAIGVAAGVPVDLGALRWPESGNTQPPGDTMPPSAPTGLNAAASSASQINLSWTASTDNVGVTGYDVYRDGRWISGVSGASFSDTGLAAGSTYSYYVTARDGAGLVSGASNTASATTLAAPATDTTPPTVTSVSPADGTRIRNSVGVSATATDNVGVTRMEIYIDGMLKATSGTSSVAFTWNSKREASGAHSITVKAYDANKNTGTSSVTVYR